MNEYSLLLPCDCDENPSFLSPRNTPPCCRAGLRVDAAAHYRICAQGLFDVAWLDLLSGTWGITNIAPTEDITVFIGKVADQAALMGVLQQLYNLGFPLLLVEHLAGQEQQSTLAPREQA